MAESAPDGMFDDSDDVIPVRPGEDLDHSRLAAYLRERLAGTDRPMQVAQFGGGHANLTYLLRFGDQDYVLRRPPLGPIAPTAHDMGREFNVLSKLHDGYPLAPRAYLYCADTEIIGAPFFLMERRVGTVIRGTIPPRFGSGRDTKINRRIGEALIDSLADLHGVDYVKIGLGDLGRPEGFLLRQVEGWAGRYDRAKTRDAPLAEEVIAWLRQRLPESPPPTLLHNDWRLDNVMLNNNDPGRAEAVLDWDMCTVGDPLADLGTVLATWFEAGEEGAAAAGVMPAHVPGFLTRREAVERYSERRGVDVGTVGYYYVFGIFKIAVVLQQIYYRYHVGQTNDSRFESFADLVEMLFLLAKVRIDEGEV